MLQRDLGYLPANRRINIIFYDPAWAVIPNIPILYVAIVSPPFFGDFGGVVITKFDRKELKEMPGVCITPTVPPMPSIPVPAGSLPRSLHPHPPRPPLAHHIFVLLISNDSVRILKHITHAEEPRGPLSTERVAQPRRTRTNPPNARTLAHLHTQTSAEEYLTSSECPCTPRAPPPDSLITFCLLKFASNGNLFASRMLTHVYRPHPRFSKTYITNKLATVYARQEFFNSGRFYAPAQPFKRIKTLPELNKRSLFKCNILHKFRTSFETPGLRCLRKVLFLLTIRVV